MSALDDLKKVIRYYEEGKTNPSTLKNQISGETLKELDTYITTLRARVEAAEALAKKWQNKNKYAADVVICGEELAAALAKFTAAPVDMGQVNGVNLTYVNGNIFATPAKGKTK